MSRHKFLDITKQWFGIAGPESVVAIRILDESGIRNLRRQIPADLDRNSRVCPTMQHKCRNPYGWKYRSDIDLRVQQRDRSDRSWTGRESFQLGKLTYSVRVCRLAGDHGLHHLACAPGFHDPRNSFFRTVRRIRRNSKAAEENQLRHSLGICRGE